MLYFLKKYDNEENKDFELTFENSMQYEGNELREALYNSLFENKHFKKVRRKVMIFTLARLSGDGDKTHVSLHHNTVIHKSMSYEAFVKEIGDFLEFSTSHVYSYGLPTTITVRVFFTHHLLNKKISINKSNKNKFTSSISRRSYHTSIPSLVKPLLSSNIKPYNKFNINSLETPFNNGTGATFYSCDIETIYTYGGVQIPISIALSQGGTLVNKQINNLVSAKLFLIDFANLGLCLDSEYKIINNALLKSIETKLWLDFFEYIVHTLNHNDTVFVHNLNFDGVYIYRGLNYVLDSLDTDLQQHFSLVPLIDNSNKFIKIDFSFPQRYLKEWYFGKSTKVNIPKVAFASCKIIFKDSFRIFPFSLDTLCKMFSAPGKSGEYDVKEFNIYGFHNKPSIFNKFIVYASNDVIALQNALLLAQLKYLTLYNVDITTILSTASLAMKIYRSNFIPKDPLDKITPISIPLLNSVQQSYIRKSYIGGSTDIYIRYAKDIYFYDINSLYPAVMKNPLPYKIIKYHTTIENLSDFYGFVYAKIECPANIMPVLPHRINNKVMHPQGCWDGIYFSEELKSCIKLGYNITPLSGWECIPTDLFSNYVDYFYSVKNVSSGADKFIAKLSLNSIYGNFGRKENQHFTMLIDNSELTNYMVAYIIKNIIKVSSTHSLIQVEDQINSKALMALNASINTNFKHFSLPVKANVGIASAITAYARILMHKYKNKYTLYSDTDSIFTTKPIANKFISNKLGQMKNEMEGVSFNSKIDEAYFFSLKQYAYKYTDLNGKEVVKSIFAGLEPDSLNWNQVLQLAQGDKLIIEQKDRFIQSLENLNITIKPYKVELQIRPDKILRDNKFIPPYL